MNIPDNLRYTSEHEWIDPVSGKLGITEFAQSQLGDVVYLDFAVAKDDNVEQGGVLGTVESVKTVADIYAPVAGKIVEMNESITNKPESVNEDPYGEGWMFQLDVSDASAIQDASMDADAYRKLIGVEK